MATMRITTPLGESNTKDRNKNRAVLAKRAKREAMQKRAAETLAKLGVN